MHSPPLRFQLLVQLAGALALAGCGSPRGPAASGARPHVAPSALDSVVADVCGKQVVLLGEPGHHGSGPTLQAKVELVRRLTDDCRFSALFLETGAYDFINLEHSLVAGTATRDLAMVCHGLGLREGYHAVRSRARRRASVTARSCAWNGWKSTTAQAPSIAGASFGSSTMPKRACLEYSAPFPAAADD